MASVQNCLSVPLFIPASLPCNQNAAILAGCNSILGLPSLMFTNPVMPAFGPDLAMLMLWVQQINAVASRLPGHLPMGYPSGFQRAPLPQAYSPGYLANNGQTYSYNPGYGPRTDSIPDNGASNYWADFARLRKSAQSNGSLDGSCITPTTSMEQDLANQNRVQGVLERASDDVIDQIKRVSPPEREALRAAEEEVQQRIAKAADSGNPLSGSQKLRLQSEATDRLFRDGKINDELGNRNRAFLEVLQMSEQCDADAMLKWSQPLPPGLDARAVARSAFNPNRVVG